jgi:hypothetical protein
MRSWFDPLRFLWEEGPAPPEEALRLDREEPMGIPRPLRKAARFASLAVVATSLMGQVIGVRLIAPVDASPSYRAQCVQTCDNQQKADLAACASLPPGQRGQCQSAAAKKMQDCKKTCGSGP